MATYEGWFEVEEVADGVHAIAEPGHVTSFLVTGEREAALVDAGTGIADIAAVARALTPLPLRLLLTHAHWDHIGGAHLFERRAVHPAGTGALDQGKPAGFLSSYLRETTLARPLPAGFDAATYAIPPGRATPPATELLHDGDVIDLGGRALEVLYTPGHSRDGICLLDRPGRLLLAGDLVYAGALYAQLAESDLPTYARSLRRVTPLAPDLDVVLGCHGLPSLPPRILDEAARAIERVMANDVPYTTEDSTWGRLRRYGFVSFDVLTQDA